MVSLCVNLLYTPHPMDAILIGLGGLLLLLALGDAFETIVLPRTVQRGIRLTPLTLRTLWACVRPIVARLRPSSLRQTLLVAFAPMTVVFLIAVWALSLIVGYSLIHQGYGTPWTASQRVGFGEQLYVTATDFFTLGLGDRVTTDPFGRFLCVLEAGTGFGFLALVIGFLPVFYSAFSRREVQMLLLDSKAGSQPTAAELLKRHGEGGAPELLADLFKEYERWSAELLEGYLSYPFLVFYRSQHDDQSWLVTLTALLDACALVEVGIDRRFEGDRRLHFQARSTFAMARHVIVDLAYVLNVAPDRSADRLSDAEFCAIREELTLAGLPLRDDPERLRRISATYEPYVCAMARYLLVDLPRWRDERHRPDNWQTSAWDGVRHF